MKTMMSLFMLIPLLSYSIEPPRGGVATLLSVKADALKDTGAGNAGDPFEIEADHRAQFDPIDCAIHYAGFFNGEQGVNRTEQQPVVIHEIQDPDCHPENQQSEECRRQRTPPDVVGYVTSDRESGGARQRADGS